MEEIKPTVYRCPTQHAITALENASDTNKFYSGNSDGQLVVWDMATRRPIETITCYDNISILQITQLSNTILATQGRNGAIKLWDATDLTKNITEIQTTSEGFCKFAVSNNGNICIPDSEQARINVWSVETPESPIISFSPSTGSENGMCMAIKIVNAIGLPIQDELVFALYESGMVYCWKWTDPTTIVAAVDMKVKDVCVTFDVQVDEKRTWMIRGCIGGAGNTLVGFTYNMKKNKMKPVFNIVHDQKGLSEVKIRSDGKIVALAGWGGNILVYNWKNMELLAKLQNGPETKITALEFEESCTSLMAGSTGKIELWGIYPPND